MKGIILAGGNGSRLYPVSRVISKQLLPVYDKPMIYYPLSTLMLSGIRDILIITTPKHQPLFQSLLGDGHELGLSLEYAVQDKPEGIAQAFVIGEKFIGSNNVALILGDNIFYGEYSAHRAVRQFASGALIFAYYVHNPGRYGVIEFDREGKAVAIEEKPHRPKSNYVVTGMYMYSPDVVEIARKLKPSRRGELEITEINQNYLDQGRLQVIKLGRGFAWLDTGTHESMLAAGNFIATIEQRQGLKVACVEEIAYRMKFIDRAQMDRLLSRMTDNSYRVYLEEIIKEVESA